MLGSGKINNVREIMAGLQQGFHIVKLLCKVYPLNFLEIE